MEEGRVQRPTTAEVVEEEEGDFLCPSKNKKVIHVFRSEPPTSVKPLCHEKGVSLRLSK